MPRSLQTRIFKILSIQITFFSKKNQQSILENVILFAFVANGFRGESWYWVQLSQSMTILSQWRWDFENPTIISGVIRKIRLMNIPKLIYVLYYTVELFWYFFLFFINKSKSIKLCSILFFLRMLPLS